MGVDILREDVLGVDVLRVGILGVDLLKQNHVRIKAVLCHH